MAGASFTEALGALATSMQQMMASTQQLLQLGLTLNASLGRVTPSPPTNGSGQIRPLQGALSGVGSPVPNQGVVLQSPLSGSIAPAEATAISNRVASES